MEEAHGSWVQPLVDLFPESAEAFVDPYVVTTWVVILTLALLAWAGTRHRARVPSGLQTVWEIYVQWVRDFCRAQIGPGAEKYAPMLGTLFVYILFMNLWGMIPGFIPPTMSLNLTAALALSVFLAVQYSGIRELGLKGYLMHFVGEPVWMAPINIPVHVIGELAKPLSLAIRLFGNMFGEETAIYRMMALGAAIMPYVYVPLPVHFVNVLIHLIIAPIQAFIFFILSAAYIEMVTHHHGDEEHGEDTDENHLREPTEPRPEAA
ncbi:MAG: F0F1 ATP synthase subunit A [Armatimonadota bacterium]|jgi:F-type H+-transporting ATPase subunit a